MTVRHWRIWLAGLLLFASSQASAHLLKVFAYAEGLQLHGSSYFAGGSAASGAQIRIFNQQEQLLGQLLSDEQGEFSFLLDAATDVRVVADSGDGHQAEWWLSQQEQAVRSSPSPLAPASGGQARDAELALLVEQAVARQVGPLRQQLDRFSQRTKLADVVGGLGFIFGLAGMLMWWRSRR